MSNSILSEDWALITDIKDTSEPQETKLILSPIAIAPQTDNERNEDDVPDCSEWEDIKKEAIDKAAKAGINITRSLHYDRHHARDHGVLRELGDHHQEEPIVTTTVTLSYYRLITTPEIYDLSSL